ncbi:carboxypeptidase regulatory-like domain-containing protein, partial [Candidatus Bathyarchaeota archaeon]
MQRFGWVKSRAILFMLLAVLALQFTVTASADISGSVTDPSGAPIEAKIRVFHESREIAALQTAADGAFNIQLDPGQYTLTVYADKPETPGFDYLPAVVEVEDGFVGEIALSYGATLRLNGDFQYIDTENIPLKTSFTVQDGDGNSVTVNGFPLDYSDKPAGAYAIPDLAIKDIIIPLNMAVDVNVSSNILVNSEVVSRGFIVRGIEAASQGELIETDI